MRSDCAGTRVLPLVFYLAAMAVHGDQTDTNFRAAELSGSTWFQQAAHRYIQGNGDHIRQLDMTIRFQIRRNHFSAIDPDPWLKRHIGGWLMMHQPPAIFLGDLNLLAQNRRRGSRRA